MTKVIAALDNSPVARPVILTAAALARLLGAQVEALHVSEDGARLARSTAEAAGVELGTRKGPTVDRLVEAGSDQDVVAMVLGTRGTQAAAHAIGATALDVVTSLAKPLVIVPPDVARPGTLQRILLPLEGTISTSLAPKAVFELADGAKLEIVVLHIHDEASLPAFTDQPQHETMAWAQEFLARYCPWGVGDVHLDVRVGRRDEQLLRAAEETGADLIALGWSQELAAGRAPVVRAALEWGHVPVLLIPVQLAMPTVAPSTEMEEESCSSLQSLPV